MIIAVDGPTAAGKGTLARRLAMEFGLTYLDTGALYRATALGVLRSGSDGDDVDVAVAAARSISNADLQNPELRDERVGQTASKVAAMQPVRAALLQFQRDFAAGDPGAVLDGRDIGTFVCPGADVKLFVTASEQVRASRRHSELISKGQDIDLATVLADLQARDQRDSARDTAPLRQAEDAHLLDTSELDIEAAFRAACALVRRQVNI